MKKVFLTLVLIMFFMFPVMVNATEADILDKMLTEVHNKLQEAITTEDNVINTNLLNELEEFDKLASETDTMFDGFLISVADYVPSISVSVFNSNIKFTGIDVVLVLTILIGVVTLVLVSRKKSIKAN